MAAAASPSCKQHVIVEAVAHTVCEIHQKDQEDHCLASIGFVIAFGTQWSVGLYLSTCHSAASCLVCLGSAPEVKSIAMGVMSTYSNRD
jgi:hypothetical protein